MNARELAKLLENYRYPVVTEEAFQDAVEKVLTERGVPFKREHILSPQDRVDFMVGDIALELKTQGAPNAVNRQLQRYAQSDEVKELVLLTCKSALAKGAPMWLSEKRVAVAFFMAGGF